MQENLGKQPLNRLITASWNRKMVVTRSGRVIASASHTARQTTRPPVRPRSSRSPKILELNVYILCGASGIPRKVLPEWYNIYLKPKLEKLQEHWDTVVMERLSGRVRITPHDNEGAKIVADAIESPDCVVNLPTETLRFAITTDPAAVVVLTTISGTVGVGWKTEGGQMGKAFKKFQELNGWSDIDTRLLRVSFCKDDFVQVRFALRVEAVNELLMRAEAEGAIGVIEIKHEWAGAIYYDYDAELLSPDSDTSLALPLVTADVLHNFIYPRVFTYHDLYPNYDIILDNNTFKY